MDSSPKCIRCSGINLKLVNQTHRYSEHSRSKPISTLSFYQCVCGTGFTRMVHHELPKAPAASV